MLPKHLYQCLSHSSYWINIHWMKKLESINISNYKNSSPQSLQYQLESWCHLLYTSVHVSLSNTEIGTLHSLPSFQFWVSDFCLTFSNNKSQHTLLLGLLQLGQHLSLLSDIISLPQRDCKQQQKALLGNFPAGLQSLPLTLNGSW